MPIARLAGRLYQADAQRNKILKLEFGLGANGKLQFNGAIDIKSFDYLELYDGDAGKLRFSLRALPGKFIYYDSHGKKQLVFIVMRPFPLARFPEKSIAARSLSCQLKWSISEVGMFGADGSLNVSTTYASGYNADGEPGNDNGITGYASLDLLSNPEDPYLFERRLFATNASKAITPEVYPVLAKVLHEPNGIVFKDITPIAPDTDGKFPDPRTIEVRPVGIRRRGKDAKHKDFVTFGARVQVAPSSGTLGSAHLWIDDRDDTTDVAIPVSQSIDFHLIPDVFHQRDLAGPAKVDRGLFSYLWVTPLPPHMFAAVWNERVVRPYFSALRMAEDAHEVSFVPFLENISGDGNAAAFEAIFDVVQSEIAASDAANEIVLAAIRPIQAVASFSADAIFPGLIDHAGESVRRRVLVEVERETLAKTFGWFDTPQPSISGIPEISIRISAMADPGPEEEGAGIPLRFGALDIEVPRRSAGSGGHIDLRFSVTFDPFDASREHYATKERDPKGVGSRARLPRNGEAIPRIVASIDRFDLSDVRPGSQDPTADSGRAFDAVIETLRRQQAKEGDPGYTKIAREKRIARNLDREAPVVVVDRLAQEDALSTTPFFLKGEEITETGANRRFSVTLHRLVATQSADRAVVIDTQPFAVAAVGVPVLGLSGSDALENDGEFANWETSELGGDKWEIAGVTNGFDLFFPPQATGEAMEKGAPWIPISKTGTEVAIDYRLGTSARLSLQSSYFKQQYAEAPWNLRRIFGTAGERAPGAGVNTARFEFLYGLAGRVTAPGLRLAEIGTRIGSIRTPLPARPEGITRTLPDRAPSYQPLVEAELYDRFRDVGASFTKVYETRLAQFDVYREGVDGPLSLDEKVAFELRPDADLDDAPWNPESISDRLKGGATRGFESKNIFEEVMSDPTSTRGQVVNPSFSALGGYGFVRAFFADGKTRIVSDTNAGRTQTYALERIGRIGVFWNIAKHVIVYERTVLPPDQFSEEQEGQHLGRPIVRKVREYVEVIEAERAYPEKGGAAKSRGFVEACLFRTRRIPVNSRWGRDVEDGWIVPLWRPDADKDLYPKPEIRLQVTSANADAAAALPTRFSDPSQLVFFTSTRRDEGDDPNEWIPRADIDFVNVPAPGPVGKPTIDPANPDGKHADDLMRDPLLGRCTFDLDGNDGAVNLVSGRTSTEAIGAVLETVTMMRSRPTGNDGGAPGQALVLRQQLERIVSDARRLETVFNNALSTAQAALAGLLRGSDDDIKTAIDAEIDRFSDIKGVIHREAASARQSIGEAVVSARTALDAARSKWTDEAASFQGRVLTDAETALLSRLGALNDGVSEIKGRIDAVFDGATADSAQVAALRIEQALAPILALAISGVNRISDGLERLERALAAFITGMTAAQSSAVLRAAELKQRLMEATDRRSLLLLYEPFHQALIAAVDAAIDVARRNLPPAIKNAELFPDTSDPTKRTNLDVLLNRTRRALVTAHDKAIAGVQASAADSIQAALDVLKEGIDGALAMLVSTASDLKLLVAEADGYRAMGNATLARFTTELEVFYEGWLKELAQICEALASDVRERVLGHLQTLQDHVAGLRSVVASAVEDIKEKLGGLLDEVGGSVSGEEAKLAGIINDAGIAAASTITTLENALVDAVDQGVAEMKAYSSDVAGLIGRVAAKLQAGADAVAEGLRQQIPPSVADNIRVLEEGYKRLEKAPSLQNPSETLALVRAAGASPILPNLSFNRDRIAYFFDDARDAIRTSPMVALMNRVDDDLKALGIRVPTDEILERFVPKGMENFDFGQLFPDLGGLKLDGLFRNLRLPALLNDRVKLTHGFDKASLTGWAKAEASAPLKDRSEIFEFGPLKLSMIGGAFDALADIAVSPQGSKRTTRGEIVGDWELAFSGQPLVTLEKTRVFFEDGKGLDVDIEPSRIRLDKSIKFLSDLIKSFSEPNSGFFLEMLEENGLPAGASARVELPLPPLSFGAFSVTGLRFSSAFELLIARGSGGKHGDFALSTMLALGRKSEPFVLRVWLLVGGGWLETRARYFPSSGKLSSAVSIGLTAGLGLDFAAGPCRGFVYAMFGAYAEFETDGEGSANFSIAVIFLVRGGIVILGRFNIGLSLLLELVYRDDGTMVGRGTIDVSFKICWCCEIKVRQAVTYNLTKSKSTAAAPSAHHLDSFA